MQLSLQLQLQLRRLQRAGLCTLLALSSSAIAFGDTTTPPKKPTSTSSAASTKSKTRHTSSKSFSRKTDRGKKSSKKRGQQAIDSSRTREIQSALIREHYLQGEPTGFWDSGSQAAMQRYQADHGWQSKTTPDSRALIQLGLGPSSDHLLNPESAMTTAPTESKTATKQTRQENMSKQ